MAMYLACLKAVGCAEGRRGGRRRIGWNEQTPIRSGPVSLSWNFALISAWSGEAAEVWMFIGTILL